MYWGMGVTDEREVCGTVLPAPKSPCAAALLSPFSALAPLPIHSSSAAVYGGGWSAYSC